MNRFHLLCTVVVLLASSGLIQAEEGAKTKMDEFAFGTDKLKISFYGHASLMLDFNGLLMYVDPVSQYANFAALPKADIILVTHEHSDHLDAGAIGKLTKGGTEIVVNRNGANMLKKGSVLQNGERLETKGIRIEAVPAYNMTKGREKFHPEGRDNGYLLTLGSARVYVAGDTEDIPEMASIKNVDIAFLPVNQPYTMNEDQASHAARMLKPIVLYPYHLGNTDLPALERRLKENREIDVRMRNMQ